MKNFLKLCVPGFNKLEIKAYHLHCPQCGCERMVELRNPDFESAYTAPDGKESQFEPVDTVPKKCPKCGRRLGKRKIPIPICT